MRDGADIENLLQIIGQQMMMLVPLFPDDFLGNLAEDFRIALRARLDLFISRSALQMDQVLTVLY